MAQFNPELHTPEALADQLQRIYDEHPEALLVGSLGRAAVYHHIFDDAEYEYSATEHSPLQRWLGAAADIDLLNGLNVEVQEDDLFEVDTLSLGGKQVNLHNDGINWLLESPNRKFKTVVFPQAMKPLVTKTVYGADCRTVSPQTHLTLIGLTGEYRPQDIEAYHRMSTAVAVAGMDLLPLPMFYAFDDLKRLNNKSGFAQLRGAYRAVVPFALRQRLSPATQIIKDHKLK